MIISFIEFAGSDKLQIQFQVASINVLIILHQPWYYTAAIIKWYGRIFARVCEYGLYIK